MRIWMAAAENGALRGGKVGGVGDVMRDLPAALVAQGHDVSVLCPAYGVFHRQPGAERAGSIRLAFGGRQRVAALYRLPAQASGVRQFVIEHSLITVGHPGRIYHDDGPHRPFATDAGRFAFFSAALAAWVEQARQPPEVLHLHDWHTGPVLFLRRFDASHRRLRSLRCVFSIHNLAYQGIRPLAGQPSSLESWFPGLAYDRAEVVDPRYPDCVNPMAMGVRLADRINTVSPGYAREILQPSDPDRGFIGGEGLERDLQQAGEAGRLVGILNGCTYPGPVQRRPGWERLRAMIASEPHLFAAYPRVESGLARLPRRRPPVVMLSIGRVTGQKSALFLQEVRPGQTALEAILELPGNDFVFIMLGSGETAMESRLAEIAARADRFLFLRGYSDSLPELLYAGSDLFLMPSSFEPCGISQMLAMRAGTPCVVHAVGGLRDTVRDGINGFSFRGASPTAQGRRFVAAVKRALEMHRNEPGRWKTISEAAATARFTWDAAARRYLSELYA